jgi:predicted nucleic acid-binding protein
MADARDNFHIRARAIERILRRAGSELVCTNYIVAETHALALNRAGRELALSILHLLNSDAVSVVRVDLEDEAAARAIIERYTDKEFSLVDATSFVVMEALGLRTAFTFDEHFAQYGFTML